MKIAIAVPGRFHAFDLARALLERGHDVTLMTNYPGWAVERFGMPGACVRSFWGHGVLARAVSLAGRPGMTRSLEPTLHRMFGRWVRRQLEGEHFDVVYRWSGVAEESLRTPPRNRELRLLLRGSAHIRAQARLLEEEERRCGVAIERPSRWMIEREEREYELADRIVVPSSFARDTFVAQGVPADRVRLLPLGAWLEVFRATGEVAGERCRRLLSGEALRVLYVGGISFRKGLWDLAEVVRRLAPAPLQFVLVGSASAESRAAVSRLRPYATMVARRPEAELPAVYEWADVFLFPTIEDGYAVVLSQAAAAGLPILTTTNCSGPDSIDEGENGWVVPIRSPGAIVERLRWCDTHRQELAAMVERIYEKFQPRDWSDVAADFEAICRAELEAGGAWRSR